MATFHEMERNLHTVAGLTMSPFPHAAVRGWIGLCLLALSACSLSVLDGLSEEEDSARAGDGGPTGTGGGRAGSGGSSPFASGGASSGTGGTTGSGLGSGSGGAPGAGGQASAGGATGGGQQPGVGGSGNEGGSGGAGGNDPGCVWTIDFSEYDHTNDGCSGFLNCKGQLHFTNKTSIDWLHPVIAFDVEDGVHCTDSHAGSKWIITDDGSDSHQCVFTAQNPDARGNDWSIPAGEGWSFGYDTTQWNDRTPNQIDVVDESCVAKVP
jgi:hypothetical protein